MAVIVCRVSSQKSVVKASKIPCPVENQPGKLIPSPNRPFKVLFPNFLLRSADFLTGCSQRDVGFSLLPVLLFPSAVPHQPETQQIIVERTKSRRGTASIA
jgi:hypothetical protein